MTVVALKKVENLSLNIDIKGKVNSDWLNHLV